MNDRTEPPDELLPKRPMPDSGQDKMNAKGLTVGQFTIRGLLILTAMVAAFLGILNLRPWVIGMLLVVATVVSMPAMLSLLVYGRNYTRAFGLGALIPLSAVFILFATSDGHFYPFFNLDDRETQMCYAIGALAAAGCGIVAQAVRWWCLRAAK